MNAPNGGQVGSRAVSDFLLLNEEIAALVRARLPLETHLRSLAADLPKRSAGLAQEIGRRLDAGETLADAMQGACSSLPAAYRAAIVAGVESGQLGGALESLADSATRMEQLRRVIGFAILYPLMIFVLFCVLLAIIVGVVAQSFGLLHQPHFGPFSDLVGSPRVVFVLSVVLPAVAVLLAAVWWWRSARLGGSGSAGGVFGWLPWVRKARYWGQAATFSDLLRMLIERGLPLDRSLAGELKGDGSQFRQVNSGRRLRSCAQIIKRPPPTFLSAARFCSQSVPLAEIVCGTFSGERKGDWPIRRIGKVRRPRRTMAGARLVR